MDAKDGVVEASRWNQGKNKGLRASEADNRRIAPDLRNTRYASAAPCMGQ